MTKGAADYNYRRHQRTTLDAWGDRTLATWSRVMAGVLIGGNPTTNYQRDWSDDPMPNADSLELVWKFFPDLDESVMRKAVGLVGDRPGHRAPIRELILFVRQYAYWMTPERD